MNFIHDLGNLDDTTSGSDLHIYLYLHNFDNLGRLRCLRYLPLMMLMMHFLMLLKLMFMNQPLQIAYYGVLAVS